MSAETITAALPRTPEASPRPIDSNAGAIAQPPEDSALLRRLEATSAGEGSRQEDSTSDQRQREQALADDLRSAESKFIYPSPIPSLPAPLVPIREVPALEGSVVESNPILDGIASKRTESTTNERLDTAENQFESRATPDTDQISTGTDTITSSNVPVAIDTPARREETPEQPSDSTRPNAGTERVLQSVVLSQAQDKPSAKSPDSESSGRIVSFSR